MVNKISERDPGALGNIYDYKSRYGNDYRWNNGGVNAKEEMITQ
jgi:hypothetical protein